TVRGEFRLDAGAGADLVVVGVPENDYVFAGVHFMGSVHLDGGPPTGEVFSLKSAAGPQISEIIPFGYVDVLLNLYGGFNQLDASAVVTNFEVVTDYFPYLP